jgi:N-acetylglucosaminyldiphosphoundecaprenol N-acetyl-beta-D-mannosaminyltransferase
MNTTPPARVTVAGIEVDNLNESEALSAVKHLMGGGRFSYLTVVNAAKIVAATRNEGLRQVLSQADLVTADGMSVVWASRLLGNRLKQRVTGIDLFARLVALADERGWPVYLLGAGEEVVAGVAERLKSERPNLNVAGYNHGYFRKSESAAIAEKIRTSGALILFVAMGSPLQEFWIAEYGASSGVRFAMGVGGSFDHVSGRSRRAPRWLQRAGFEWLYRLVQEPTRLWRRYLIGNTIFVWLVAKQRLGLRR